MRIFAEFRLSVNNVRRLTRKSRRNPCHRNGLRLDAFAELCRISDMATDGSDTRERSFRVEEVRALARSIDVLQAEFGGIVAELDRVKFDGELPIDGGKKLYELLEYAVRVAIKLRGSYLTSQMAKMPEDGPPKSPRPTKKK